MSLIFSLLISAAQAEDLKNIHPTIGESLDISPENVKRWETALKKLGSGEDISPESYPKDFDETLEGPWQTVGGGCSWYCGGEMYKQSSSSHLPASKTITYTVQNTHDFDLRTAWSEGKDDYGIGESISFYFKPKSPRVNQIQIWNGYQKTTELYAKNSRPKTLKLYINGEAKYMLHLQDTMAVQLFSIAPVHSDKDGVDLELKLEIVEVYKGSKWKDTTISEINFNGLDVH